MNIDRAIKKIDQLTINELEIFVKRCDSEIAQYKRAIKNYSADKLLSTGLPFLEKLKENKRIFERELESR